MVFSWIRRRVSYVNVIATLVLLFAMSGGALAAKKYLITSTKQISPSVLKSLKGQNGAPGTAGAQGAQGSAGAGGGRGETGPAGPPGPKGEPGGTGVTGGKGTPGVTGVTGATGTTGFTKTLPAGATETGSWGVQALDLVGSQVPRVVISFPIPLSAASTEAHYFNEAQTETGTFTAECPGTLAEPQAAPGNLCVYTTSEGLIDSHFTNIVNSTNLLSTGYGKTGAVLSFNEAGGTSESPGQVEAFGTWAVTAP